MTATLRPYIPRSWFHAIGCKKVQKDILAKLPDVKGCLFLTLTFDPNLFASPESAFEVGRDKIRRIFDKLRRGVMYGGKFIKIDAPYFVKLEFTEEGWPHFHLIFRTRKFLRGQLLNKLWGLGRTNVKRISNKRFRYLLKYVAKGGKVPEWVLRRTRIRIIQSSHGFYLESATRKASVSTEKREPCQRPSRTIGERLEKWSRMALYESSDGRCCAIHLAGRFEDIFNREILTIARSGHYAGNQQIKITRKVQLLKWIVTIKTLLRVSI